MRKGVNHVEFSVLDYDESIKFYDQMFGWLGYKSFSTRGVCYNSTYYMTSFFWFHSYIGFQPAQNGDKLKHADRATGVHHIALWAKNRKEVDDFYNEFLVKNNIPVTDKPAEYSIYAPGYYAVFFDDPINGIHWELAFIPRIPSIKDFLKFKKEAKKVAAQHPEWKGGLIKEFVRKLPQKT